MNCLFLQLPWNKQHKAGAALVSDNFPGFSPQNPLMVMDSKMTGTNSLSAGLWLPMSHEPGVGPFPLSFHLSQEDHIDAVNTRALMEDVFEERQVEQDTNRDWGCVAIVQVSIANFIIIGWDQTVTAVAQREYRGVWHCPVASPYRLDRPRSQDSTLIDCDPVHLKW